MYLSTLSHHRFPTLFYLLHLITYISSQPFPHPITLSYFHNITFSSITWLKLNNDTQSLPSDSKFNHNNKHPSTRWRRALTGKASTNLHSDTRQLCLNWTCTYFHCKLLTSSSLLLGLNMASSPHSTIPSTSSLTFNCLSPHHTNPSLLPPLLSDSRAERTTDRERDRESEIFSPTLVFPV